MFGVLFFYIGARAPIHSLISAFHLQFICWHYFSCVVECRTLLRNGEWQRAKERENVEALDRWKRSYTFQPNHCRWKFACETCEWKCEMQINPPFVVRFFSLHLIKFILYFGGESQASIKIQIQRTQCLFACVSILAFRRYATPVFSLSLCIKSVLCILKGKKRRFPK